MRNCSDLRYQLPTGVAALARAATRAAPSAPWRALYHDRLALARVAAYPAPGGQDGRRQAVGVGFHQRPGDERHPQHEVAAPLRATRQADVVVLQLRHGRLRERVAFLDGAGAEGDDDL